MKIPGSVVDEINATVDIVQLVGENVELKKSGARWFGLCPFHSEKSPSFTVNSEKGFYHCFGCGAGGDAISFVMRFHSLEFTDAVQLLADKYGIRIDYEKGTDTSVKDVISLHEELALFGLANLYKPEGKEALDYLYKRGLDDETIQEFKIGYLPDRYDTAPFKKKYGEEIMLKSGLFKETQYGVNNRFYNRVMFPIRNITGKTIAFSGRILGEGHPKYVNSPETEAFKKRSVLYNMDKAKEKIKKDGLCIVTEGFMDAIRLHSCGFQNSVATMGTALTKEHISILLRYAEETVILFDGDTAGITSALKSIDVFMASNYFPFVLFLEEGEDPDTYLLKYGNEKFSELLGGRKDLLEYTIDLLASKSDNVNKRMNSLKKIREKLMLVKDPYRKEHYVKYTSEKFDVDSRTMLSDLNISSAKKIVTKSASKQTVYIGEREFIACLFKLPEDVAFALLDDLSVESFNDIYVKKIFKKIVEVFENGDSIIVLQSDPELGDELYSSILIHAPEFPDPYPEAVQRREIILERVKKHRLTKQISDSGNIDEQTRLLREKFLLFSKNTDGTPEG